MDEVRDAFKRVKEDFSELNYEFFNLKEDIEKMKDFLVEIGENLYSLNQKVGSLLEKALKTEKRSFQTDRQKNQTGYSLFKPQKAQYLGISTGNEGVKTNRQTNQQTDNLTNLGTKKGFFKGENSFEEASNILDSLDDLKKEIRLKFKKLTDQEVVIFSTIYQLEEEKGFADYKSLSLRLSLSESSIRDYVRRLIFKGIPLDKKKINNKEVHLFVSQNLKKIASLSAILKLRDL